MSHPDVHTVHMNISRILLCLSLVLLSGCVTEAYDLTILHTNDVRARVEQTDTYGRNCTLEDARADMCYGGMARMATQVKRVRQLKSNVLLLDSGNRLHGTDWSYFYKGEAQAKYMKMLQYDAMTLGLFEFIQGVDGLAKFLSYVDGAFSVLGCNIDTSREEKLNGLIACSVTKMDGKVGIIGVIISNVRRMVMQSGIEKIGFVDPIPLIENEVRKLTAKGTNIIICLSNMGYTTDIAVAQKVEGLDVIVGGHSGVFLHTGPPPNREVQADDYPVLVQSPGGNQVLVAQAYRMSKYLGQLDITFDDDGRAETWSGNPVLLDSSIKQDDEVLRSVNSFGGPLSEFTQKVIGQTYVYLDGERHSCRREECSMGDVITDAVLYHHLKTPGSEEWTHVSMAVWNSGGIESSLQKGVITETDVISILPYGNRVALVRMTGEHIRQMLEFSVAQLTDWRGHGRFLQMSGMRVVYNLNKAIGSRVLSVRVLCTKCQVPEYNDLDDDEEYHFLTNQYIVDGGNAYDMSNAIQIITSVDNITETQCLANYIKNHSPIIQGVEERIRFVQPVDKFTNSQQAADISSAVNAITSSVLLLCISLFVMLMFLNIASRKSIN